MKRLMIAVTIPLVLALVGSGAMASAAPRGPG